MHEMIRLSIVNICYRKIVRNILYTVPIRDYSVIKHVALPGHSATITKIKKAIRASNMDLDDLFSCIRTNCPICPAIVNETDATNKNVSKKSQQTDRPDLFVNKTTGINN